MFLSLASVSLPFVVSIVLERSSGLTCYLPFVVKPCTNDGLILACSFSLNSTERRRTCNPTSRTLIFTTVHIELFIIVQYYQQLALGLEHAIDRLIIEPEVLNETFRYLHWLNIPVLSIAIPTELRRFEIIHETDNLQRSLIFDRANKSYWLLTLWPVERSMCKLTVIEPNQTVNLKYDCPRSDDPLKPKACGVTYSCLEHEPCFFSGYRRLVCHMRSLHVEMMIETLDDMMPLETLYIVPLKNKERSANWLPEGFLSTNHTAIPNESTLKQLVIVISTGVLLLSNRSFHGLNAVPTRIEHGPCADKQLMISMFDDDGEAQGFEPNHIVDYTAPTSPTNKCYLNTTNTKIIQRMQPSIVLKNTSRVDAGEYNVIVYLISGLPPFTIQWFRNNGSLGIKTLTSKESRFVVDFLSLELFILSPKIVDHGAEYEVHVRNRFGEATASTRLNVTYPPVIITPLRNLTVARGTNITIQTRIMGNPAPDVYVQCGKRFETLLRSDVDESTYQRVLHNMRSTESGSLTIFVVSRYYKRNVSQTVSLTILGFLRVKNALNRIDVDEGDTVNVSVEISHSIVRAECWMNNILIDAISIDNDRIWLTVENASLGQNGSYEIRAWDILNQTCQVTMEIHVRSIRVRIVDCDHGTIANASHASLQCQFEGKNPQIQWYNPARETIFNQSKYVTLNRTVYLHAATLVFSKLRAEYFGTYTLEVNGTRNQSVIREVNFTSKAPSIASSNFQSEQLNVHPNDSLVFTVHFTGIPWPNVSFLFNNETLVEGIDPESSPATLLLSNLSMENEGIYYARVMNSAGMVETNRTELRLLRAPRFAVPLPNVTFADRGENVSLIINVTGNPRPSVRWLRDANVIVDGHFEYRTSGDYLVHSLLLPSVSAADVGNYCAVVSNSESTTTSATQLLLRLDTTHAPTSNPITDAVSVPAALPTCDDDATRVILVVSMTGLIGILLMPCFCSQRRVLGLFIRRRTDVNDVDPGKNHDPSNSSTPSPQSPTADTE